MNNEEKNTYTKIQITKAFIELLKENEINKINILDITNKAEVSRNSFYRNFKDKEDILKYHIKYLLDGWQKTYESESEKSNALLYGSLFKHLYNNKDFYLLLKEKNLFHLFLNTFMNIFGVNKLLDNQTAYGIAFISYGTYGWIEEWINRGMQEDSDTITKILLENSFK